MLFTFTFTIHRSLHSFDQYIIFALSTRFSPTLQYLQSTFFPLPQNQSNFQPQKCNSTSSPFSPSWPPLFPLSKSFDLPEELGLANRTQDCHRLRLPNLRLCQPWCCFLHHRFHRSCHRCHLNWIANRICHWCRFLERCLRGRSYRRCWCCPRKSPSSLILLTCTDSY